MTGSSPEGEIDMNGSGKTAALVSAAALCIVVSARCGTVEKADSIVLYVSPGGGDTADGTEGDPFAALTGARDAIRALKSSGGFTKPVTVVLRGGTYEIDGPFTLTPGDSGTESCPVAYRSFPGETAVISGGRRISGWKDRGDGVWTAALPEVREGTWNFRQLHVNGERRKRPRLPREGYFLIADFPLKDNPAWSAKSNWFRYAEGDIDPGWTNIGDVEIVCPRFWVSSRQAIASIDEATRTVTFRDSTRYRYSDDFSTDGARYYADNVFEAFDEPGEWYLDRPTGTLFYRPLPGEDMMSADIVAPFADQLVRLEGRPLENAFVEHVAFEGLAFSHNNWMLPPGLVGDGQSAPEVEGAIYLEGARHCAFRDCAVTGLSSYAVQIDRGCTHNRFEYNELADLGGGGFRIGGGSAYDHPLLRTGANVIADNHIHHIGLDHHAATGVWIQHAFGNRIVHNHIHHTYYSSIAIGWVWGYARSISSHNVIEYNHVHDVGQGMLSDMGGIYLLGEAPGTVVRNNYFHDITSHGYGGWGIYTDEGSSNVLIENNVVFRTKCGGFHQHYGRENIIRNNIFAFSTEGQIIKSRVEPHLTLVFENNIVYWTEGPLLGGRWDGKDFGIYNPFDRKRATGQTTEFDYNVYYNPTSAEVRFGEWTFGEWKARGRDRHSVIADPLFADPENGDFTLSPGSPALMLGFVPIDLGDVGPREKRVLK